MMQRYYFLLENMYRAMMIFWLTCLVGYPRTSAPEPKNIIVCFYLLIFFHPFNPYNPCSFHHWVFCRTRIYKIDTDGSLLLDFVGWCSLCTLRAESPTAHKGRIRQNPASDRRYEILYRSNSKEHPWKNKSVASALSVIDFERGERAKGEWAHTWGTVFQTK